MKTLHYDSLGALLNAIDHTRTRGTWTRYQGYQSSLEAWGTLDSLETSLAAARTLQGREDACAAITALAESLAHTLPAPQSIKRVPTWGRSGNRVSINRVLAGNLPHAWRRTIPATRPQHGKILTLVVPVCMSASVSDTQIQWTSAASLASALLAEQAGYRVSIYAMSAGGGYVDLLTMVQLKRAEQSWNTQGMAIAAHASFLRRLLFRAFECQAPTWGSLPSGYGQVQSPTAAAAMCAQWALAHGIDPATLLYGAHQADRVTDQPRARAWLTTQLLQVA